MATSKTTKTTKTQKPTKTPKTLKKPTAKTQKTDNQADAGDWEAAESPLEFTDASLSWEDRQLLGTVTKFLFSITDKRFLRRAVRAGYSKSEHKELWGLFDVAAGRGRTLDETLVEVEDPDRHHLLTEIDEFENLWFPRVDKIIRRRAPKGTGDAFVAAFFKNLKQQPFGPAVLDSVSTLLTRVDELETSKLPGAATVLQHIRARGLTVSKAKEIRWKIQQLRDGLVKPTGFDENAAAAAEAKQADGLADLRLAWNDWSTTLRPLYDIREQIQLGLTDARGPGSSGGKDAGKDPEDGKAADAGTTGTDATTGAAPK